MPSGLTLTLPSLPPFLPPSFSPTYHHGADHIQGRAIHLQVLHNIKAHGNTQKRARQRVHKRAQRDPPIKATPRVNQRGHCVFPTTRVAAGVRGGGREGEREGGREGGLVLVRPGVVCIAAVYSVQVVVVVVVVVVEG